MDGGGTATHSSTSTREEAQQEVRPALGLRDGMMMMEESGSEQEEKDEEEGEEAGRGGA